MTIKHSLHCPCCHYIRATSNLKKIGSAENWTQPGWEAWLLPLCYADPLKANLFANCVSAIPVSYPGLVECLMNHVQMSFRTKKIFKSCQLFEKESGATIAIASARILILEIKQTLGAQVCPKGLWSNAKSKMVFGMALGLSFSQAPFYFGALELSTSLASLWEYR